MLCTQLPLPAFDETPSSTEEAQLQQQHQGGSEEAGPNEKQAPSLQTPVSEDLPSDGACAYAAETARQLPEPDGAAVEAAAQLPESDTLDNGGIIVQDTMGELS
jgi:hypothetical protein